VVDINVQPFEIETTSRHGDVIRADVYLPKDASRPFPILLGASPYQKVSRPLPVRPAVFPFIEYGPTWSTSICGPSPGARACWQ
jgi:uncharacterized protein